MQRQWCHRHYSSNSSINSKPRDQEVQRHQHWKVISIWERQISTTKPILTQNQNKKDDQMRSYHAFYNDIHPKLRAYGVVHDGHLEGGDLVWQHSSNRVRKSPLEMEQWQLVDVILRRKHPQRTIFGFERPMQWIVQAVNGKRAQHGVHNFPIGTEMTLYLVAMIDLLNGWSGNGRENHTCAWNLFWKSGNKLR